MKRIVPHRANLEGITTDPAYETVFFRSCIVPVLDRRTQLI
jgi:hypothetical protein